MGAHERGEEAGGPLSGAPERTQVDGVAGLRGLGARELGASAWRLAPGLFPYLDARARAWLSRYRRAGAWCYLRISFLEARLGARRGRRAAQRKAGAD